MPYNATKQKTRRAGGPGGLYAVVAGSDGGIVGGFLDLAGGYRSHEVRVMTVRIEGAPEFFVHLPDLLVTSFNFAGNAVDRSAKGLIVLVHFKRESNDDYVAEVAIAAMSSSKL